ncbi:hypothetical protein FXB41_28775 [Bradyrhizobium canariense]|uniref:hypothetical protein n=1 Tax=Bradyrhizobium canariense TaxID=255045 RepID=UPI001CA5C52E|nr:hypothetical protein [Bradyrhizobium canariense]MBW5438613.1 hypothetical protein [Bradyrhizobium canariense]
MNKPVAPKQLSLRAEMMRDELSIESLPPLIDPRNPRFEETPKIGRIEPEESARDDRSYDDFDWSSDPSVVLQGQRATAVYRNKWDHLVVRQEKTWDEESDPFFVISKENCHTFLDRICDVLDIPSIRRAAR